MQCLEKMKAKYHVHEPLALQINRGQPYRGKKPFVKCDNCGRGGHVKADCYWLIGRPEEQKRVPDDDFRKKNYAANNNNKQYNLHFERQENFNANNVVSDDRRHYAVENEGSCTMKNGAGNQAFTDEQYKQLEQLYGRSGPMFSDEQYKQIQEMMNDKNEHIDQHNLAGTVTSLLTAFSSKFKGMDHRFWCHSSCCI